MRRRFPRPIRNRRRRLSSVDPMNNPRPGSEELEEWVSDMEEWMLGSPGSNLPAGGPT